MRKRFSHILTTVIMMAIIVAMIPVCVTDTAYAGELKGSKLKAAVNEITLKNAKCISIGNDLGICWDRPSDYKLLNGYKVYYSETKDGKRICVGYAYPHDNVFFEWPDQHTKGYYIIKGYVTDGDKTYYTKAKKIDISKVKHYDMPDISVKKSSAKDADFKITTKEKGHVNKGVSLRDSKSGKTLITMSIPYEKDALDAFYNNGIDWKLLWQHGPYYGFKLTTGYGEKVNIVYDIIKDKAKKVNSLGYDSGNLNGALMYEMSYGYPGHAKYSYIAYDGTTICKKIAESDYAAKAGCGRSTIVYAVVDDEAYDGYSEVMPFDIYEYNLLTNKRTYYTTISALEVTNIEVRDERFIITFKPDFNSGTDSLNWILESYVMGYYYNY